MINYSDYAAAHRRQQLAIWSAIESGDLQRGVDIFAAGIQYGENKPETVSPKRKRKKRRLIHKILKILFTRV